MQLKLSAIALALVTLAAATPVARDNCSTGTLQCCQSVSSTNDPAVALILRLLGINLSGITAQVGVSCTSVSAAGVGSGSTCTAQPVCCSNNTFNGTVALGCGTPINITP